MRNLTLLLAVMVLAITACSDADVESPSEEMALENQTISPLDFGNFISPKEAHDHLSLFLEQRALDLTNGRDLEMAYGWLFDLEKVQELVNKIDEYNSIYPGDPITGIRIYNVLNEQATLRNMMWVPIKGTEDAFDYFSAGRLEDGGFGPLNDGSDCPPYCPSGRSEDVDIMGSFISLEKANVELTNMLDQRAQDLAEGRSIELAYGSSYGLNKVKAFLDGIRAENLKRSGDEKLTKIRVYQSLKNSTINGSLTLHKSILFMPVQNNLEDLINIHDLDANGIQIENPAMILNDGRPCPPDCPPSGGQ